MAAPRPTPRVRRLLAAAASLTLLTTIAGPATAAAPRAGYLTQTPALLKGLQPNVSVQPLITVGDTLRNGYRFEAIPDGIAVAPGGRQNLDIYVNHETSTVPFPATLTDFDNAQLSHLVLKRGSGKVLDGELAIPSSANYQRFCSNFFAGAAQGFDRELVLTNEETSDFVNRTGAAWPPGPNAEQAGVVVAYDPHTDQYRSIYGMGRMNHENAVAIPGFSEIVVATGDDTFSAPSSQFYVYRAANANAVWNDQGHLWAFVSDNANINDYGDLSGSASVSGHFIQVPDAVADGDQTGLESWSNSNNVFQFIRVEDIAYDRLHPNVVYFADTGEPRAIPNQATGRLMRGSSSTHGPYPNGRIFRMEFDPSNPAVVDSLSILIDGDAGGYNNPAALHQPDNLETTARSLLIQEDPGGHNRFNGASNARIWKYDLKSGALAPVAEVDPTAIGEPATADWESSGIVDVSAYFGRGAFLTNVQAHNVFVETAPLAGNPGITRKREGGQLLLIHIPGA